MKKPGNLLIRIIARDYKGYRREMFALIVCEAVFLALIYTCAASYQKFTKAYSSELFILFQEGDVGSIFASAGLFLLFSGLIVTMTILVSYLRKRIPDYVLLRRIGITGKDMRRMILSECGIAYSFSVIIGFALGIAMCRGLEIILAKTIHENVKLGGSAWFTYPVICACVLIMFLLGFAFLMELEGDFLLITGSGNNSAGEKLTGRLTLPLMLLGILLSVGSAMSYRKLYNHENPVYIVVFLLGLYLFGRNLAAIILLREKRERSDRYYSRLLLNNRFYFRLSTISRYVLIYSALSAVTCFYIPLQIAAIIHSESTETLFPYDFVCMADDNEDALIGELKMLSDAEITEYPMVRVTTALKTERLGAATDKPIQGQQIGISESTYHSLKKAVDDNYINRDLHLDENGDDVYIVHQQDKSVKAQPVDWYYGKSRPNLHIGLPCVHADFFNGNTTFYEKRVAGEEIGSLIGCYSTEKNENIIVMSDKAFSKAQNEWKRTDAVTGLSDESAKAYFGNEDKEYEPLHIQGPTKLVLVKVGPENYGSVEKKLEEREEAHLYIGNYDSTVKFHYSSETAARDINTSRSTRMILCFCMLSAFLLMKALILYAMCQMEREERCKRDRFLSSVGATVKLRKKIVRREILVFYVLPLIIMCITAVVFSSAVYSARMYSPELIGKCAGNQLTLAVLLEVFGLLFISILCIAEERGIGISDE